MKKNLIELTRNIIPKTIEPKIFSGVFKNKNTSELNLITLSGYSVDDVYSYFEKEIKKEDKNDNLTRYELVIWASDTIPAILEGVTELQIETEKRTKNELIEAIVETQDKELFEKSKDQFNEEEIQYIDEKLKVAK